MKERLVAWQRNLQSDRAQAFTIIMAFATLILFALLYAILQEPVNDVINATANHCKTSACTTGRENAESAWDWLPLFALMLISVMLVAAGIFKSRGPN